MISPELATQLDAARRARGLAWEPESGDRFVIPNREIEDIFVVAEMTIEVHELASGSVIRFNGTTEWALDSIPAAEVLWLPREAQLRDLVGDAFARLERLPGEFGEPLGFAVVLANGERHVDVDPEDAYARALLAAWS
ncbi:MAG: pilus assembly protein CpaE [Propionibacteriaceae bacterium]|nr:pilus assembly protein CpaE [Propionibacteriaceae bacterium]